MMQVLVLVILLGMGNLNGGLPSQPVLYSLNLPANPFQQPYFQIMAKEDSTNSAVAIPNITTVIVNGTNEDSALASSTMATTDYVSYYWNSGDTWTGGPTKKSLDWYTVVYGLSPYIVRGYSEGSASTLHLQRPAQVQLPFIPNGGSTIYATFPDYTDVFLAQTGATVQSQALCGNNCGFSPSTTTLGSWYKYNPAIYTYSPAGGHCHHYSNTFGAGAIAHGTLQHMANGPTQQMLEIFYTNGKNYWPQTCSWGPYVPYGYSSYTAGNYLSSCTSPKALGGDYAVYTNLRPIPTERMLSIAPVITPGNVGYDPYMNTLWMTVSKGDLSGNFSGSVNMYLSNPTQTYGLVSTPSMNYYELFAQNMQYFNYKNQNISELYATPGQGLFADCLQLAGTEAVGSTSPGAVFTGATSASNPITGPLMINGTVGGTTPFSIPQAFASKVTQQNFLSGVYFANASSGWAGALGPQESALEYYLGVVPHFASTVPYLPLYFLEPGKELGQPGTNYCSAEDFSEVQMSEALSAQLYVSRESSPMTNFSECLSGTRRKK